MKQSIYVSIFILYMYIYISVLEGILHDKHPLHYTFNIRMRTFNIIQRYTGISLAIRMLRIFNLLEGRFNLNF